MPSITSLSSPNCFRSSTKCGISITQGPHHVAQKTSITVLPLYWLRVCFWPLRSVTVKSGAFFPYHFVKLGPQVSERLIKSLRVGFDDEVGWGAAVSDAAFGSAGCCDVT